MVNMTVQLRSIAGTEAAAGWAGGHTIVVDRPDGKAGGMGLGFNGGQLLALAIGGCFCNDLQYVAHDMRVALDHIAVDVTVHFDGDPLVATSAEMTVDVSATDKQADVASIIRQAQRISTVSNSLSRGIPIETRHKSTA